MRRSVRILRCAPAARRVFARRSGRRGGRSASALRPGARPPGAADRPGKAKKGAVFVGDEERADRRERSARRRARARPRRRRASARSSSDRVRRRREEELALARRARAPAPAAPRSSSWSRARRGGRPGPRGARAGRSARRSGATRPRASPSERTARGDRVVEAERPRRERRGEIRRPSRARREAHRTPSAPGGAPALAPSGKIARFLDRLATRRDREPERRRAVRTEDPGPRIDSRWRAPPSPRRDRPGRPCRPETRARRRGTPTSVPEHGEDLERCTAGRASRRSPWPRGAA